MKKHEWVLDKDDAPLRPGQFPDGGSWGDGTAMYRCSQCGLRVKGFSGYGISPRHVPKDMETDCDMQVVKDVMTS